MSGTAQDYTMDYVTGQGDVIEQFKAVSSITECGFTVKVEEETSPGGTNVYVPLGDALSQTQDANVIVLTKDVTTPLGPGQHLWDAKINTSANLDTGANLQGPTIKFRVTIASPDLATVTASSSTTNNPAYIYVSITFKNECRDLILDQQFFGTL